VGYALLAYLTTVSKLHRCYSVE